MRHVAKIAGAVLIAAVPVGAQAAEAIALPVSSDKSVLVSGPQFDWSGFYAGIYGVIQSSPLGGQQYGLGLDVGAEARFEMVLVGGEVALHSLVGGTGGITYLQGIGKIGVAVTDNLVAYAAGGVGVDLGPLGGTDALLGGGLELAVTDAVSVDARYLHGFALSGGNPKDQVRVGANFHF